MICWLSVGLRCMCVIVLCVSLRCCMIGCLCGLMLM